MELAVSASQPSFSPKFLDRLMQGYAVAISAFDGPGKSMWSIIDQGRQSIHSALIGGDRQALAEQLLHPSHTTLYYGVDELYFRAETIQPVDNNFHAAAAVRDLQALGRNLGVLRLHNPEGGELYPPGSNLEIPTADVILELLADYLSIALPFPNPFPGEWGLQTAGGIATVRAIAAIYQAHLLTKYAVDPNCAIVEIGAGMGRTAFYANLFGRSNYTIVDLPLSLIGQAAFLALVMGEDAVRFADEPARPGATTLLTPQQFADAPTNWKIALNVDSMPEMDRAYSTAYLDRLMRDEALFLSINHEANIHTVNELVPRRYRLSRGAYMLRVGYLEEIYQF